MSRQRSLNHEGNRIGMDLGASVLGEAAVHSWPWHCVRRSIVDPLLDPDRQARRYERSDDGWSDRSTQTLPLGPTLAGDDQNHWFGLQELREGEAAPDEMVIPACLWGQICGDRALGAQKDGDPCFRIQH